MKKRIFRFVRDYSYAIYLVHHQIIYLIMRRFQGQYLALWQSMLLFALVWAFIAGVSITLGTAEKWIVGRCGLPDKMKPK